ncbi:hypothetical protein ACQPW1_29830 [Nocardia sp. CA-128927]|uniref:hypothetical protein n=1 Tax=Nocardia sp. CA-128927 TaxID=3239975 RepID=UPI003D95C4FF
MEYTSINTVYGRGPGRYALGSVKTHFGHSEPALNRLAQHLILAMNRDVVCDDEDGVVGSGDR